MKVITIPDLHGKRFWQEIDFTPYDKVIFLGDYVDSNNIPTIEIIENLKSVIDLKRQFPHKIVLLMGNHDMQYRYFPGFRCSGFDWKIQKTLTGLFTENADLFQFAYSFKNHLWSHAGISNNWFNANLILFEDKLKKPGSIKECIVKIINNLETEHLHILNQVSYYRGGSSSQGGILWADMEETSRDYLTGFHQYVGHTRVSEIKKIGDETSSITYLDCLDIARKILTIDI